ncbi:competence protein ComEA [Paenibacillus turicensis]|uniref:Competence protein ComEA n=1 Tax=Paenibacillus turicensis TaxID=160487 RepID=A0ABS4FNZ6_9BACL|nr:helix-hairpin-helix domain-containing protein [Paenibacillus turicensis]MBP1904261.1 competence protein ComEA [Paenibacillus turicensis]
MYKSKFILAITSAVMGAGLMFVVTNLTSSPAIEGWTPVNTAVASTLVEQQQPQSEQQLQSEQPSKQEQNQSSGKVADSEKSAEQTKRVNINTAGLVELQNIPGVGEKKAQTIIDYRNKHGAFKKVQDLTKVKGIGTKSFQKMKPFIEIGS